MERFFSHNFDRHVMSYTLPSLVLWLWSIDRVGKSGGDSFGILDQFNHLGFLHPPWCMESSFCYTTTKSRRSTKSVSSVWGPSRRAETSAFNLLLRQSTAQTAYPIEVGFKNWDTGDTETRTPHVFNDFASRRMLAPPPWWKGRAVGSTVTEQHFECWLWSKVFLKWCKMHQ